MNRKSKLPVLLSLFVLPTVALAQSQEELVKRRDAKKALPVFQAADWLFDYDDAKAAAKKDDRVIFAFFCRSFVDDPQSTALENVVLQSAEFAEFGRDVVLLAHLTTQVVGDEHQGLFEEMGGRRWPYLVFLDAEGTVLCRQVERSVDGFATTHKAVRAFRSLEKQAETGDKQAGAAALAAGLELGRYGPTEGRLRLRKLGVLPVADQQRIDGLLLNLEVAAEVAGISESEQAAEIGRRFLVMEKQGRIPTGRTAVEFYSVIMETYAADNDALGYERVLTIVRTLLDGQRNSTRILQRYESTLERLKQQKK